MQLIEVNGIMVQEGVDPLHGITMPGGNCAWCTVAVARLDQHIDAYGYYGCTSPLENSGAPLDNPDYPLVW